MQCSRFCFCCQAHMLQVQKECSVESQSNNDLASEHMFVFVAHSDGILMYSHD